MPNFLGFSPKKFDRNGNYNFGINRLDIFPTIDYNLISAKQGLQITIVFSSSSIEENIKFLKYIDFPLLDK